MTTMPAHAALQPADAGLATASAAADAFLHYSFDEPCSILLGWRRRDGVLRMLSATHAVVGGVAGLRPGDRVRLVLYGGEAVVRDCRVTRTTLQGIELQHHDMAGQAGADARPRATAGAARPG